MRRRRRNPTELERLIDRLEKIAEDMAELEPEPEADDWVLQDLLDQKREIERDIAKRRKEREKEKIAYQTLKQEFNIVERQIKRLDPDFTGL